MKRTTLGIGEKSLDRGSTFASRGSELKRTSGLSSRGSLSRTAKPKRRAISPASPAQREKVRDAVSIVSGQGPCDPCHLWARGEGGCDDPLCCVPLTRQEHRLFDAGDLDLEPYLIRAGMIPELQHALGHAQSLTRLIRRVSGS